MYGHLLLPLAMACMQACEFLGLPECQLTLSQTVCYLACAPKSNAATTAIGEAETTENIRLDAKGKLQGKPLTWTIVTPLLLMTALVIVFGLLPGLLNGLTLPAAEQLMTMFGY